MSPDISNAALPQPVYLKDYRSPDFHAVTIELLFDLDPASTRVTATMQFERQDKADKAAPLRLDGVDLHLVSVALDRRELSSSDYQITLQSLVIANVPDQFTLTIITEISPAENFAMEGLYLSSGRFFTQCEPEAFRRMTYALDRPDNLARFTTTLIADKAAYPILLSNGNRVGQGDLPDGKHFAKWEDPFPKPTYLFALVAGDFGKIEDYFTTMHGRDVRLEIYAAVEDLPKCGHAMRSLKHAMKWDEETYGREYDLDLFMIVAVGDFNMGAMENKGLNIFNTKYVLVDPETATDADFEAVEAVIGHEYFHNWSGNRVTCRDWFQLSLKEGLTVFREQEFSAAMGSAGLKRIEDVRNLRAGQFPEDGGPMAHPVRPASYIQIDNFYTQTVYSKGGEVIRMLKTLLGPADFRRGMDLYFARYDGQAVTCEDFVAAMAEASGLDLGQFQRWYNQAGTPTLKITTDYNQATRSFTLTVAQSCPPTPRQPEKLPFVIPLRLGLLDENGHDLILEIPGEARPNTAGTRTLTLTEAVQSFTFLNISSRPVPSLLRGFSAPVKLEWESPDQDLAFLAANDPDPYARWQATQSLAMRHLLAAIAINAAEPVHCPSQLIETYAATLRNPRLDDALKAELLSLPDEASLAEATAIIDVDAIHIVREAYRRDIGAALRGEFTDIVDTYQIPASANDAVAIGRRSLRNLALSYLMTVPDEILIGRCRAQSLTRGNMTDQLAGLRLISRSDAPDRDNIIGAFGEMWAHEALVIDKWFALQASMPRRETLAVAQGLLAHPWFSRTNPNRLRSVISTFAYANPVAFHQPSGAGYRFLSEQIIALDQSNPQIAARMVLPLIHWRRFDETRQALMRAELERLQSIPGLSSNSYEIVLRGLAA